MRVALHTTFRANKKEPLGALLERIHTAFLTSGVGEPSIALSCSDAPVAGFTSGVERLLKRHPELKRLAVTGSMLPGGPVVRQIAGEGVAFSTVATIAAGVPRSFPFHNVSVHFQSLAFGLERPPESRGVVMPGVIVGDSWWVSGRERSVSALTVVEADSAGGKLPALPEPVAAVFAVCGKVKSTVQVPLAESTAPTALPKAAKPSPEVARAVNAVVLDYRARLAEIIERAALPHDLPSAQDALMTTGLAETTGPKKPVLVRAFKPLGYDCRAGSGTFTLRRRTSGNLTVEIDLDVGTWSRSLTASFSVVGLGFKALFPLPVSKRAIAGGQYKIGNAERWHQIVDNLAAVVAELDRGFVPAVEAASGPSPAWFTPES
jgi:hypothetical protein